jgi:hypothetical protein
MPGDDQSLGPRGDLTRFTDGYAPLQPDFDEIVARSRADMAKRLAKHPPIESPATRGAANTTVQRYRFFVARHPGGRPSALARISADAARADRLVAGGQWERYPSLRRLVLGAVSWTWEEINPTQADAIAVQLMDSSRT